MEKWNNNAPTKFSENILIMYSEVRPGWKITHPLKYKVLLIIIPYNDL